MLLQGFPERYVLRGTLSEQITMVSDAVAPPVARALALALVGKFNYPIPEPPGYTPPPRTEHRGHLEKQLPFASSV